MGNSNRNRRNLLEYIESIEFLDGKEALIKSGLLENVCLEENVRYGLVNGRELLLDACFKEKKPSASRPAVIFVHGGGWKAGDSKQFSRHAAYLSYKHNLFTVCINYRFSQEAIFPAALQDTKCAVRWVRSVAQEYNIDTERIAIVGGSAGGHLSAMVTATAGIPEYEGDGGNEGFPSHVKCAVLLNAVSDFFNLASLSKQLSEIAADFLGGTAEEIPERYTEASPVYRINKGTVPMLILHGDKDIPVPCETAIKLHNKLQDLGIQSEIEIYKGKGHAWFNHDPDFLPVLHRVETYLMKQLTL